MKYILYARKSTEDEDQQILSIETQIFELKEFAAKEKPACHFLLKCMTARPDLKNNLY